MVDYTVISTFAGCGGSSLGYKMAGFKELLAIDFNNNAVETFKLNFPEIPIWNKDIKEVKSDEILKFCNIKVGELDILDGSPPCQGFSTSGNRNVNDDRNDLFKQYIRLIKELEPKIFVMENVSGQIKGIMKGRFLEIITELKKLNYNVKVKLLNSANYSIPQSRERLFYIGIRKDLNIEPIFPKHHNKIITCKEALNNCKIGEYKYLCGEKANLIHKVKPGESMSKYASGNYFNTLRIHPNKPCPTIPKTFGEKWGSFFAHYESNRSLSINELKRLASFPDDFIFIDSFEEQWARIGNSVMPLQMKAIADVLKIQLDSYYSKMVI